MATKTKLLYRSEDNRVLGGVAGGLGEYFETDPSLIRIAFLLLTVFGGSGILVYIILWLVIPSKNSPDGVSETTVRKNAKEIQEKAEEFGENLKISTGKNNSQSMVGILLLIFGIAFLLNNFGLFSIFDLGKLWPIVLVVLGYIVLKKD